MFNCFFFFFFFSACRLYLNLQKLFAGESQYAFLRYAVLSNCLSCLIWLFILVTGTCPLCSFQILVLLMHMDLLETDFGALTLIHLLFQQIPPIRLLLIWSLGLVKKIWRPGLTGKYWEKVLIGSSLIFQFFFVISTKVLFTDFVLNWSYEYRLRVALGPGGDLTLISRIRNTNSDGKPFSFTFAYHTYFSVSDIR